MSKNMFLTSVRPTHPGIPIPISGFDPLRLDNRKVETEVSPSGPPLIVTFRTRRLAQKPQ